MKNDNILLEALKEIRDLEVDYTTKKSIWDSLIKMEKIASAAIQKYSLDLSPSDESNQELQRWFDQHEYLPESVKDIGDNYVINSDDVRELLKSQYKITKR